MKWFDWIWLLILPPLAWAAWQGNGWATLVIALNVLADVRCYRKWLKTAHRPHVDKDWGARVWAYRASDGDHQGLIDQVLWAFAAWAPFGAKMIWRDTDDQGRGRQGYSCPYMARVYLTPWWFPRAVFLHRIFISDNATHDHPYGWSLSLILTRGYREVRATVEPLMVPPVETESRFKRWLNYIPAGVFHALELTKGPVWTIFLCGPRDREWGFLHEDGTYTVAGDVQRIATRRAANAPGGRS